jgi:hypothetical protein
MFHVHNWAASQQNQHNGFVTSMDPDQPTHPRSLVRIHTLRLPTLLQVEKLIANSMYPDQTARMRRLVLIHAGRKRTMLVFFVTRLICSFFRKSSKKTFIDKNIKLVCSTYYVQNHFKWRLNLNVCLTYCI